MHETHDLPAATRPIITIPGIDHTTIATATGERMNLDLAVLALHQWLRSDTN
jgi:hypothetical protein